MLIHSIQQRRRPYYKLRCQGGKPCINCGYDAKSSHSLGSHLTHCQRSSRPASSKHIKRRRHPSQPVSIMHSIVAHGTKVKRDFKQKQDRAVSYTANCTWNRPSLASPQRQCWLTQGERERRRTGVQKSAKTQGLQLQTARMRLFLRCMLNQQRREPRRRASKTMLAWRLEATSLWWRRRRRHALYVGFMQH